MRAIVKHCLAVFTIVGWLLTAGPATGQSTGIDELHAPLDELLRSYVVDGEVDYAGLATDQKRLGTYLDSLSAADVLARDRDEQLALWINAYNAFTLQLILDHYPGIASIKDIPRASRWKDVRWNVGGTLYSLDQIEHEILRPRFGDPRIHFAIVCASVSCPDLREEAYTSGRLETQLDVATRGFLSDPRKGARTEIRDGLIWGKRRILWLSSLFDWFEEDFIRDGRSVIDYVAPLLDDEDRRFVEDHREDLELQYMDYDWGLNGR